MRSRHIAIIGAGAAGICAAKYLLAAGHRVTLFEIGTRIGGVWEYENDNGRSSAYASLHINTEKRVTQFHDHPFPETTQLFPSHRDMASYLRSYADRFGVAPFIRFRSTVTAVHPIDAGAAGWDVEIDGSERMPFDAVVAAGGHLSEYVLPPFAGDFTGELLHSHHFRRPEPFAGKRVLVVGTGNSACDITADLAPFAARTVMSSRSPALIVPKLFLGLPVTQLTGLLERPWLPRAAPQAMRRAITRLAHGRMERWGLRTPRGRTHPTSHPTLINLFAYQRASVRPGIASVEGKRVLFIDGSTEDFDTMICATGYALRVPFAEDLVPVEDGGLRLYRRVVPPSCRGLYFVGYFNTAGSSNLRMFEHQSRWIAELEAARCALPDEARMREEIARDEQYYAKHFPAGPRYAIEIDPVRYARQLKRELAEGRRRARREGAIEADRPRERGADAVPGSAAG